MKDMKESALEFLQGCGFDTSKLRLGEVQNEDRPEAVAFRIEEPDGEEQTDGMTFVETNENGEWELIA